MEDGVVLTELLRLQEDNARLTREISVLRHQLESKDRLLDSLQCAVMDAAETPRGGPRRRHDGCGNQVVVGHQLDAGAVTIRKSTLTNVLQVSYGRPNAPFVVQTPIASVPFGLDDAQRGHASSRHVTLKFPCDFVDKLVDIQKRVQAAVTMPEGEQRYRFVPFVRDDGNVRVTLASACCAYDAEGRPMDIATCLQPGASVECILRCNGVWHSGGGSQDSGVGRVGVSWSLLQVRCRAVGIDMTKYAFVD